jgi:hypothetical protein
MKIQWRATAVLVCTVFLDCAQTGSYAPKPVAATYRLENFSKSNLQVVVRDFLGFFLPPQRLEDRLKGN